MLAFAVLSAQDTQRDFNAEIKSQDTAIEALKREIESTRAKIRDAERQEKTTANSISQLDKEISLTDQLLNKLKQEERRTRNRIKVLEQQIPATEQKLAQLRARYTKRAVSTYKKGTLSPLISILSSESWRQAVYRIQYLQIISGIEVAMLEEIKTLLGVINNQRSEQEMALGKTVNLSQEQQRQRNSLNRSKTRKQQELKKIVQDKTELAKYVAEKQEGLKELEAIRNRILADKNRFDRADRIRRQQNALNARAFAELKGQLLWPAEGRVVQRFGQQHNEELNTTTENPGIDIKGQPGSPIRAVLNGIVTTITFIRGYGTTIIIDHGDGYYTVYSHVTDLQVHIDSEVRGGDVIAYMGEAGSINGAKLHFEIWGQNQKLNPELWLN
jgi:septal ring factor EnvC (AmiA/AmiB activator)